MLSPPRLPGIHLAEVSPLQVLNHYELQWHCSVIDPALSDLPVDGGREVSHRGPVK